MKFTAEVDKDHTLRLELPEEIGEGPAEVIVLVADSDYRATTQARAGSLDDFLAEPQVAQRFIRSKEEIDDYLRAERASWEE